MTKRKLEEIMPSSLSAKKTCFDLNTLVYEAIREMSNPDEIEAKTNEVIAPLA